MKAIGARVCQLRDEREWTQETLSERSGLDRSYIAGIESGSRNPSLKVMAKLAAGLEITLARLFESVP